MVKETKAPPVVSASRKRSYRSLVEPLPGHSQGEGLGQAIKGDQEKKGGWVVW